jgi:NAD(P)-dependent dehydrogenase (short-subunit alcohol dehydrogenase family)
MMERLTFDGRVALVTGAGRGLGRAHALLLGDLGAKVVVNDLGGEMDGHGASSEPAESVVAEIRARGGHAVADVNDVSSEVGANGMVCAAIEQFGRLDVVIHNAGVVSFIPFGEMTYTQYRKLVAVHQDGAFLVAKAAWPQMIQQGYGRFVFITSLAGMAGLTHYASAKAALCGFVRSLSAEGAGHGIYANALSVIAYTRLMAAFFDPNSGHVDLGLHGQREIEAWWRDYLRPEQVSQVVAWLAHELCMVSGETFFTGGGQVSRQFIGLTEGYANMNLTPRDIHAAQRRILDPACGYHVYEANGLDKWLFDHISSGGAPKLPAPRPPSSKSAVES